jgi:hypothetical protein
MSFFLSFWHTRLFCGLTDLFTSSKAKTKQHRHQDKFMSDVGAEFFHGYYLPFDFTSCGCLSSGAFAELPIGNIPG